MKSRMTIIQKKSEGNFTDKNGIEWEIYVVELEIGALVYVSTENNKGKFDLKIDEIYSFFIDYFNKFLYDEVEKYVDNFKEMDKYFEIKIGIDYIGITIKAEMSEVLES